jgi:2-amino-4-hydroxy-6-hydroxymethyldihydropteridine diphosphokinase
MPAMGRGYIGIGSNVGDRERHVRSALVRLEARGVAIDAVSSVWETEPMESAGPARFLNLVVRIGFEGDPPSLLARLLDIEREAGRRRLRPNAPRELDLDLLWVDGLSWNGPDLVVPHPRMWRRAFVLAPLAELDPDLRDPATGRTALEALAEADGGVRRIGPLDRSVPVPRSDG